MKKFVYTTCEMCTGRCPLMVEVLDGEVKHIWGNPHVQGGQQCCPRGAAAKALLSDNERPQHPLIRDGERGSGKWRQASWDEAYDYIADRLKTAKEKYGAKSILLSDRGGPMTEFERTFLAAIGSPNYFNHHATCSNSVHNAHMSIAGHARNSVDYDYENCKYMVLFGRNIYESIKTTEAKTVMDMQEAGGKMVCVDVRWNYTAAKSDKFFIIRPGTDYALTLALIHQIIKDNLYDPDFVNRWVLGFDEIKRFTIPYTPEWAEKETGIPAKEIIRIAHEAGEAKPAVIFHPGWMTSWFSNDYYLRRAIYTLNALMGSYETKGGIYINKKPGEVGLKYRTLIGQIPKVKEERFDGVGTKFPHLSDQWGLAQMLPHAILNEDPYPIKAYIVMRHDPLASLPDPDLMKKAFAKLDLLVSIDINYSETGWFSDVILPESTFLERTDHVYVRSGSGLTPHLTLIRQAVKPRFDTKGRGEIFKALADRMGVGQFFPYNSPEELVAWQLEGSGYTIESFDATGVIEPSKEQIWYDRKDGIKFNTPSGKIELISSMLEKHNIPSFIPYESPPKPAEGSFRLVTSKVAVHTQGRTTANIGILNELYSENHLWMNTEEARKLGISDGDTVEVSVEGYAKKIGAKLTDHIHPEVVFMLHGFGDTVPLRTKSFGKGVSDIRLQRGLLKTAVGGNCPLTECVVAVKKTAA
ncbi:MAG: molybdopterin-dependent oxidoreductase [Nitrospirae bacterium]|nr:molybdopterin-dependent oxidoreductase [Nitrospirota bacterium]